MCYCDMNYPMRFLFSFVLNVRWPRLRKSVFTSWRVGMATIDKSLPPLAPTSPFDGTRAHPTHTEAMLQIVSAG